jgi:hypothetical protein
MRENTSDMVVVIIMMMERMMMMKTIERGTKMMVAVK